ncbi:MAG: DinB family protein [Deltaproteobacteria bacterium]|nr:DinB family protein [Deltaproteobacteria bacterium]
MEEILPLVRSVLATTPSHWNSLTRALPPELLSRAPAPGQWSALECLQHLIDTERIFCFRLQCLLEERDFPAFDPDKQGTKPGTQPSPPALAAEFARLRAESLQALSRIGPSDLGRKARHQELGIVTMGEMVHEWSGHDLNHTIQAERAIMQPFIRGCGPWQKYFSDHLVKTDK